VPGRSNRLPLVGLVFAVVAVVGSVAFDWQFGGTDNPVVFGLAALAVVLALGSELRSRL
jgi:hypothetical protein